MKWILLLLFLTAGSNQSNEASSEMFLDFIDVGQGDATLIQQDEYSILIDCGPRESNLINFLNNNLKEKEIDLLIVTHPDLDHFGGCYNVTENFKVNEIWENPKSKGKNLAHKGDAILLKDIKIEILSPEYIFEKENDNSLVTLVTFSNFQALIMGDCEQACESQIEQEIDLLRIGHHGSYTSTSKEFIDRVNPQIAIISVGENNYGHPSGEVLTNLKDIPTLRTDQLGTISFKIEKNGEFKIL